MSKVSFLVVNYFSANYLNELVISIKKYFKILPFEILIYNNSCTQDETEKLNKIISEDVLVYNSSKNIGFVAANNFLFKNSTGNIIVLINPDVLLINDSLNDLIKMSLYNLETGIIGPKLLNPDLSYQVSFSKFPNLLTIIKEHILLYKENPYAEGLNFDKPQNAEVIKGCCMVLRRDLITTSYIFDPQFEMYAEELDLCKRLMKSGKNNYYFSSCTVIHYGEKSSNYDEKSLVYSIYHYHRSKLLYFNKHHNTLYYLLVKIVIYISLAERSILLYVFGKKRSSKIFFQVLKKFVIGNYTISNM